MAKQIITGEKEKAFDQAIDCLNNGNEKEAYEILKRINDKLCAMLEDEEFVTVYEKSEPEVISDYMHYLGEDYYFIEDDLADCKDCACFNNCSKTLCPLKNGYWKNIKDIEITDELALRRPWVVIKNCSIEKLVYAKDGMCGVVKDYYKINRIGKCYISIATVADLKKAGITNV